MESMPSALTLQMLAWIAERPRSYGETMEAWRTSCPRLSIWEDALLDALVIVRPNGGGQSAASVELTERGKALLERSRSHLMT